MSGVDFVGFNRLWYKFACALKETMSYYDTLSEYEKEKLRLMALIMKLQGRNQPLAKLVFLHCWHYFQENLEGTRLEDYMPKRGRKQEEVPPIKLIMAAINCSRRTARDYQLALIGLWKSGLLLDLLKKAVIEGLEKQANEEGGVEDG